MPENCRYTHAEGARTFLELSENPPSGDERGLLICSDGEDDYWFVVFTFDASGYVRDDDRDELDADQLLEALRRGNEAGNEERRRRGWEPVVLTGWSRRPYYDPNTNNLTWAIQLDGGTVNHSVRLLGRGGVMSAELVLDQSQVATAMGDFDRVVGSYSFLPGQRYSEWRDGDKVAGYGVTALVAGGAGAVAAKTGLFGKLWKVVAGVLVATAAGLRRLFRGGSRDDGRT